MDSLNPEPALLNFNDTAFTRWTDAVPPVPPLVLFDDNHNALTTAADNTSTAEANNNPMQQDPMNGLIDNAEDKTFEGVTFEGVTLDDVFIGYNKKTSGSDFSSWGIV